MNGKHCPPGSKKKSMRYSKEMASAKLKPTPKKPTRYTEKKA